MKARPATLLVSGLALLLIAAAAVPDVEKSQGLIVGIKGDWVLNKPFGQPATNQLKFLGQIPSGTGTCAYGKSGYVTVAFGEKAAPFLCDRKAESTCDVKNAPRESGPYACAREIVTPSDPPAYAGTWAALLFQIKKFPELFATPVSRGLEADLDDAVLQMNGGSVEFAPTLAEMEAGNYTLRLERVDTESKALAMIHVQWKGEGSASASAPVPAIAPGLYGLIRQQADGKPTGQEAWVLLAAPENFAKQSSEFESFSSATKQWPDQVDARAPRAVSRAYLQALAGKTQ
jgi:hypothetical protein